MNRKAILLSIAVILGTVFRLWFIALSPQEFKFDQVEYQHYAINILTHGLYASSARLYGYPIIVACLYYLFGTNAFQAVYLFQALVDSITGLLIFFLATHVTRNNKVAWLAFLGYLFNPFTSAYVGVLLSEITGICITTLLIFVFVKAWQKKTLSLLILVAFVGGFLSQVRPAFLYFSLLLMLLTTIKFIYKQHSQIQRIQIVTLSVITFFLPFIYTILGNAVYFREWKLTTVDRIPQRELYISVMVPGRAPVLITNGWDVYPKEVMELYEEYSKIPTTKQERIAMATKYAEKAKTIIAHDPLLFFIQRIGKMLFVWEKHTIFYYNENEHIFNPYIVYWSNMALFSFAIIGVILWWVNALRQRVKNMSIVGVYTFLLLYISVIHSVSFAEERYSLPGYPILFLFAAYALWIAWKMINGNKGSL